VGSCGSGRTSGDWTWDQTPGPSVAAFSGAGDTHLAALGAVDPAGVIGIARLATHGSLPVRRAGELLRATPLAKAPLAAAVVLPLVCRAEGRLGPWTGIIGQNGGGVGRRLAADPPLRGAVFDGPGQIARGTAHRPGIAGASAPTARLDRADSHQEADTTEICAVHEFRQSGAIRMPGREARRGRWFIATAPSTPGGHRPVNVLERVLMQIFVRDHRTMIAARG
jgi:hypothetical protein